jgi:hypothetical protein
MILDRALDTLLPYPERDWDAAFQKRLPSSIVFAAARTILRSARPRTEPATQLRAVAFGNLGDQLRFLSVLTRFPVHEVTIDSNAEAAGAMALYERVRTGATFARHGLSAILSRAESKPAAIALVPHPFITQPVALVHAMRNATSVIAASTGQFPECAGAMRFLKPDRANWRSFYETFIEDALGLQPDTAHPRLRPELRYQYSDSRDVLLHVLSSYAKRAMPVSVARSIASVMTNAGLRVTLLGTTAEEPRLREVARDMPIELFVGQTLPKVAALMASSRAFVGVDSGMMNLADAVGIPSVVLYPRTNPAVEGPFYAKSISISLSEPVSPNVSVLNGRRPAATIDWSTASTRVLDALDSLGVLLSI